LYNKLDQVVLTRDAKQAAENKWLYTRYDEQGRVIGTGIYTSNSDRATLQGQIDSQPLWETRTGADYPGTAFPVSNITPLTVNYYDDYTFTGASSLTANSIIRNNVLGLSTGGRVYTTDGSASYLTVSYYDKDGRVIETVAQNHVGGTDRTINTYSFTGELLTSTRSHTGPNTVTIANRYTYDHVSRKKQTYQKTGDANASEVLLSELAYNDIGQLTEKKLHNGTQPISYTYNSRGWLKSQTSPQFSMELKYEDHSNGALRQYNGNISGQSWGPQSNPNLHSYAYSYDKLNRLIGGTSDEGFNESLSYDVMGNISSLARNPMGTNTYTYSGNQLSSISGFVNGSYGYDVNGNQISDGPKGVTLAYNYLNLPQTITKASTSEVMTNTWLASGVKLKKVTGGLMREYVGGIEYNNGSIEFIQTEEGRARPNGGSYFYEYMLKDHLGNTRVMFDQNGAVLETSDYYPFGLQLARSGNTVPSPENRYKYNGKELQTELGLNQYDYGARFYDPVVARWNVIDPLADKYLNISPYVYVANNPINAIDPDGEKIIFVNGYIGFGSPPAGEKYWGGRNSQFVAGAKEFFADNNTSFVAYNPAMSSNADERREAGREYARTHLKELTAGMKEGEQFEFVSHSMGGAFAEGMTDVLKEAGWIVGQAVHINTFQAADIEANKENTKGTGVSTYVYDYQFEDDPVINNPIRSSPGSIKNADARIRTKSKESDIRAKHAAPIWQGKRVWDELQQFLNNALQQNPDIKVTIQE
jgi:RHS repeat-associated protein